MSKHLKAPSVLTFSVKMSSSSSKGKRDPGGAKKERGEGGREKGGEEERDRLRLKEKQPKGNKGSCPERSFWKQLGELSPRWKILATAAACHPRALYSTGLEPWLGTVVQCGTA